MGKAARGCALVSDFRQGVVSYFAADVAVAHEKVPSARAFPLIAHSAGHWAPFRQGGAWHDHYVTEILQICADIKSIGKFVDVFVRIIARLR
jgi:hypothetical protein